MKCDDRHGYLAISFHVVMGTSGTSLIILQQQETARRQEDVESGFGVIRVICIAKYEGLGWCLEVHSLRMQRNIVSSQAQVD